MKIKTDAKLLRIFVGESDKINAIPVYEKIVLLSFFLVVYMVKISAAIKNINVTRIKLNQSRNYFSQSKFFY